MFSHSKLSQQLDASLPRIITGDWIKMNSSYESGLCGVLGWKVDTNRYFDATFNNIKIEIKKGRSIWLDLARYSEIVLGIGESNNITAFFVPTQDLKKIDTLYLVDTKDIINILKLDKKIASIIKTYKKKYQVL